MRHQALNEHMIRMLDETYREFDRLMEKALAEIHEHACLEQDYETLVVRHNAARGAGAAFVVEAAAAIADLHRSAAEAA